MAELDRNKIELIEMYRDNPAAAARDLLGIDLAPHQRVILKSMWDCDNVIAVLSRGSGKCVTGDTIVMTNNGFDYIDNLCRRSGEQFGFARARCYKVFGENGFHRPKFRYINEPKKVIKIKTKFGYSITGVPKHNIRCLCGNEVKWKELGRIKIGDKAIISKDTDYVFYDNYHCRMVDFKHGYRLGYSVKYNKEGRLHYYILRCCNEGLRGFICGLFDRYSYCDKGETTLFFKTKELARFVHIGLLIYGIVSKLEEDQITIYPDYFYQFVEQISSKIENKLAYYNIVMEHLEKVEHPKYFADEIVGIEVIDNVITYDFSFDKDYTFISNGFISHNTFIDGVFSTLRALLYPGERVGLFSGSFRQAKFIFDEVSKIYDISSILRESCEKKPTKMVDQCYLQFKGYNNKPGSIIQCLPLGNGDKIRGARFFTVICDEAAQIPADILDIVIRGMMATSKNPMEQVRALQEQKRLLAEGKIDKIKKLHQNKLVLTSTAYYQYNHLWKRVELFVRLLMEKVEKAKQFSERGLDIPEELKVELRGHDINNQIPYNVMKDNQRSLITCTYEDMPEGFMNMDSIEEAKIQMPRYQFLMEYCFSSGTPVFTNYGFKNIENVNIGDLVLTHNGRFMPVTNKYERKYTGKMFDIIPFGYSSGYSVTDGHRFYTKYGFKSIAQLLRMKKTFMVPLKILNGNNNIDMTKYCNSYLLSCVNNEDYIYPITGKSSLKNGDRGTDKIFKSSIRRFINLDYHLGIVIGYYVSEGSIGSHGKQINFSLDGHIDKTLCHFIKELCDSIYYSFGIKPHKHIINNVCIVNINSVILCEFFKKICPGVSDTKIVDPNILFSNEMFMKGYLTGYWHGDGCINKKPQAVAGCVNKELLSQIMLVLSYFGFPSSIRKSSDSCIKKINGVDRNIKECWSLTMKGNTSLLFDNFINNKNNVLNNNVFKNEMIKNDEGLFYFKIKKHSERFVEDEIVYNLSVKEDESYCIPTATCHNCSLFPADSDGFFPMSVLDKARLHGEFACCESLKKEDGWINIMACDPARSGDNFAIAIVRANKETKKIRLVRVFTYNKKPFPFMHLEIRKLLNQFSINELVIDSGGGGRTIRDLLADKGACPPGEDIILQIDFEEHRYLKGKKILRLVEFSDYEWLSNANNNMLLGLQNGTFQIASEKGKLKNISGDYDENSIEEEMRREIDRTIEEIQNIVVTRTNVGRMHWDTPHRNQRKDRYSAVLMGYDAAYYYIDNLTKPQKLISGFWM